MSCFFGEVQHRILIFYGIEEISHFLRKIIEYPNQLICRNQCCRNQNADGKKRCGLGYRYGNCSREIAQQYDKVTAHTLPIESVRINRTDAILLISISV